MTNTQKILSGIGVLGVIAIGGYFTATRPTSVETETPNQNKSLAELQQEMADIAKYEFEHGCVEKNARGQDVFCGESKQKVDAAEAKYQAALKASTTPNAATQQADISGIRAFMDNGTLALTYMRSRSPANFTVGEVTSLSATGDERSDVPQDWKRTVNVYRTTSEIDGTCEVYEFEVYPKTHEVVQVQVVYPDSYTGQCNAKGDMFSPTVSDAKVKEVGNAYVARIAPSKQFTISPLARGNTSRVEWKWEDKSYQLPDGLKGQSAVDSRPTIRLHISSAGKLLQYNNTVPLFER